MDRIPPILLVLAAAAGVATAEASGPHGGPPSVPGSLAPNPGDVVVNRLGMRLVLVPAGSFVMGSPTGERGRLANEGPPHRVRISRPLLVGAHEVTIGQFPRVRRGHRLRHRGGAGRGRRLRHRLRTGRVEQITGLSWRDPGFPGVVPGDDHPVVLVSWRDTEAFCVWLSGVEGTTYRLPTEAEWEYAARGAAATPWASGDHPASLARSANVADASLRRVMPAAAWAEPWDDGFPFTAPVGSFAPNDFGLYDVHGNAWEWCRDWHADHFYARSPAVDPAGPDHGTFRAIRGGGWFNGARRNRAAQRIYFDPTFRYCLLSGFRVVREID